jgi:hypothetical protein
MSYAAEYSRFSGGQGNQFSNMLRMSPAPAGNKRYPVKMPRYIKKRGLSLPKVNLNPSSVINIAVIGGIGLLAYKLYHSFFGNSLSDLIDAKTENGQKAIASTYVDASQSKADQLKQTAASLSSKGLVVSSIHQGLANTFHNMLDSAWVDHAKIVKTILGQNIQTFRLVSVAYGTRSLPTYGNSPAHLLNTSSWSLTNLFSSTKYTGTLKDHLREILTSSEQSQISKYLAVI